MFQDVKYDYMINLAGTRDRSEYDIESYWKAVVVFHHWLDLTYISLLYSLKPICATVAFLAQLTDA